ncbi:MAG: ABC transporter ATP-binding protein [Pyrinomonadaceae bacterium MAG19_C2-C3]|nr:ABC transporter ATP-binding protein [Pyrinomonadaceae bacterium MAG19_C2-C3]
MLLTRHLSKFYDTAAAVRDVDIYVPEGETCALIGPNGAGKTTLLKMLAGLLRPTSGTIEVNRTDVSRDPKRLHETVGYVPDTFGLYDELSVTHFLDYFARANNIEAAKVPKRIGDVLSLVGLTEKSKAQVGSLSRGMRQRLVIAKTLLHAPKILLLDEPASGLDPHARLDLSRLIKELARIGTTMIVSSHILTELADFSTSVIIMERGRVVRAGNINQLVGQLSQGTPVRLETLDTETAQAIYAELNTRDDVIQIELIEAATTLDFTFIGTRHELAALHREIVAKHAGVVSFYERRLTVEDLFMAQHATAVN